MLCAFLKVSWFFQCRKSQIVVVRTEHRQAKKSAAGINTSKIDAYIPKNDTNISENVGKNRSATFIPAKPIPIVISAE